VFGQSRCSEAEARDFTESARREMQAQRFSLAADLFRQAHNACRANRSLRIELANALFRAQRFAEARETADEVLKSDSSNAAALKIKANSQYLLGAFAAAEQTLLTLLDKSPNDEDGAYMLGRMYYQEGRIPHAMGMFQRVLRLNTRSYKAYDNLGLCYQAQNQTEMAIRHFLTAIKLVETEHPGYDWPYANLAELLLEQGKNDRAFSAAAMAAQRNPNSARNFYLAGKALSKLDEPEAALRWLERATELDSAYAEPLYLLGQIHTRLGKKEQAAQYFEKFKTVKTAQPRERK
jgi:tetratricopeptide (TPR) repeat protein